MRRSREAPPTRTTGSATSGDDSTARLLPVRYHAVGDSQSFSHQCATRRAGGPDGGVALRMTSTLPFRGVANRLD